VTFAAQGNRAAGKIAHLAMVDLVPRAAIDVDAHSAAVSKVNLEE